MNYEKLVTARKTYLCTYCQREISIGSKYIKVSITPWCHSQNESFDTWHIHEDCKEAGDSFYLDEDMGGIFPENGMSEEFIKYLKGYVKCLNLK